MKSETKFIRITKAGNHYEIESETGVNMGHGNTLEEAEKTAMRLAQETGIKSVQVHADGERSREVAVPNSSLPEQDSQPDDPPQGTGPTS